MSIKAYKAFESNMICRNILYTEGITYETDRAVLCKRGFHACLLPLDCLLYYKLPDTVFHEVELDGCIDYSVDMFLSADSKVCASKITIGREITLDEMHDIEKELCLESDDNHAMNEFLESYFKINEEDRDFLADVIRKYIGHRGYPETKIMYSCSTLSFLLFNEYGVIDSIEPNIWYYRQLESLPLKF